MASCSAPGRRFRLPWLTLLAASWATVAQAAGDPVGVWTTQDGDARVRIEPCHRHHERLCGYIAWVADSGGTKPGEKPALMGFRLLSRFVPDGQGGWGGGEILDPSSGRVYRSKLALRSPDELQVSGCFLVFCGSQIWRRYRP